MKRFFALLIFIVALTSQSAFCECRHALATERPVANIKQAFIADLKRDGLYKGAKPGKLKEVLDNMTDYKREDSSQVAGAGVITYHIWNRAKPGSVTFLQKANNGNVIYLPGLVEAR